MTKLRAMARGQSCTLRFPCCAHSPETVVLAHVRRANVAGIGQKPPDLCAVYACGPCHDVADGRVMLANVGRLELDQYLLYGLLRTLVVVSKELKL